MSKTVINGKYDPMHVRIAECRLAQIKSGVRATEGVFTTALTSKERLALDRILSNHAYLHRAYVNGIFVKVNLTARFMPGMVRGREKTILFLFHETHDAGRAVPLLDLQRQAWKYLYDKSRCFPSALKIPAGGSIAKGVFTGFKAFEELCTLIRISDHTSDDVLLERMTEDGGKHALGAFFYTFGENSFKSEMKINAAVALTCFGEATVIDILERIYDEKELDYEGYRSVIRDILLKLSHLSPLALGVMFPYSNAPSMYLAEPSDELKEDIYTLRYSGHAFEIMRRLDRFHDDPANKQHFREVTTQLPEGAESFMCELFGRRDE